MTKVGIITDIHIDGPDDEKTLGLAKFIENLDADYLIISGDLISKNQKSFDVLFSTIRNANPYLKVFFVKGNHDYWIYDQFDKDSLSVIISRQEEVFKKYPNVHYLENNMFEDEDMEIYGYDGWYLHSNPPTKDKDLMPMQAGLGELTPFQYLQRKEQQAVQYIFDELEKRKDSKKTKIVVTHFNPFPQGEKAHLYENMCGNDRIFNLIIDEGVDYMIFGHSHHAIEKKVKGCTIINVGADYDQAPTETSFSKILKIEKKK